MNVGTKSVLFGVHQFLLHPFFVAYAWWKLYGFPWDPRLWVAFFVHDLGYLGKPNMDGPEGDRHPMLGSQIMHFLFDHADSKCLACGGTGWWVDEDRVKHECECTMRWMNLCLYHSRFYAKKFSAEPSRLCFADKLATNLYPTWLWVHLALLSRELYEYLYKAGADICPICGERLHAFVWMRETEERTDLFCFTHASGYAMPERKYSMMRLDISSPEAFHKSLRGYMTEWIKENNVSYTPVTGDVDNSSARGRSGDDSHAEPGSGEPRTSADDAFIEHV